MLILMIITAVSFYAGLARHRGKRRRSEGSSNPDPRQSIQIGNAGIPVGEVPVADAAVMRLTWTALDDLQLNRLLRESS